MRLLILPSFPVETNGYGIAVKSDIERLKIQQSDKVIWYVNGNKELSSNESIIHRYGKYSIKRILNFFKGRHNTELSSSDLKEISSTEFDEIFCGEVVFYRALRKLYPDKHIIVRFHNCFARIKDRVDLLGNGNDLSLLYRLNLNVFYNLEKEIMADKNVYKIFISKEDQEYYRTNFGQYSDSEVWGFLPNQKLVDNNRTTLAPITKIVWFGGLDSHKIDSVNWFVDSVYSQLYNDFKGLEFHLYGSGTQQFDNKEKAIYGHGFFDGEHMPYKEDALYINPDLTGGGVKIKLLTYFEQGVRFLTTPFGYEGYPYDLIDNNYCFVKNPDEWVGFISKLLADNK